MALRQRYYDYDDSTTTTAILWRFYYNDDTTTADDNNATTTIALQHSGCDNINDKHDDLRRCVRRRQAIHHLHYWRYYDDDYCNYNTTTIILRQ